MVAIRMLGLETRIRGSSEDSVSLPDGSGPDSPDNPVSSESASDEEFQPEESVGASESAESSDSDDGVFFRSDEYDRHASRDLDSSDSGSPQDARDSPVEQVKKRRRKNNNAVKMHCPLCSKTYKQITMDEGWLLRTKCGHTLCYDCVTRVIAHDDGQRRCPFCRTEHVIDVFELKPIEKEATADAKPGSDKMSRNQRRRLRAKDQVATCCKCGKTYGTVRNLQGHMLGSDRCHHLVCSSCLEKMHRHGDDRCPSCGEHGAFAEHLMREVFL